jgi:hypothetical protein
LLDGLFSNQKFPIWIFLEVLGMENVGISMTIWNILRPWYILWQFGIVCGNLVYFSRFGLAVSGNPDSNLGFFDLEADVMTTLPRRRARADQQSIFVVT